MPAERNLCPQSAMLNLQHKRAYDAISESA